MKVNVASLMMKCFDFARNEHLFKQLNKAFAKDKKNPQSLGILVLTEIEADVKLAEIGGQIVNMEVTTLDILDYRMYSKLQQKKSILYRFTPIQPQSKVENIPKTPSVLAEKVIAESEFLSQMQDMFDKYIANDDRLSCIKNYLISEFYDKGLDVLQGENRTMITKIQRRRKKQGLLIKAAKLLKEDLILNDEDFRLKNQMEMLLKDSL